MRRSALIKTCINHTRRSEGESGDQGALAYGVIIGQTQAVLRNEAKASDCAVSRPPRDRPSKIV